MAPATRRGRRRISTSSSSVGETGGLSDDPTNGSSSDRPQETSGYPVGLAPSHETVENTEANPDTDAATISQLLIHEPGSANILPQRPDELPVNRRGSTSGSSEAPFESATASARESLADQAGRDLGLSNFEMFAQPAIAQDTDLIPVQQSPEAGPPATSFEPSFEESIPQVKTEDTTALVSTSSASQAPGMDPAMLMPLVDRMLHSVTQLMSDLAQTWGMLARVARGEDALGADGLEQILRTRERLIQEEAAAAKTAIGLERFVEGAGEGVQPPPAVLIKVTSPGTPSEASSRPYEKRRSVSTSVSESPQLTPSQRPVSSARPTPRTLKRREFPTVELGLPKSPKKPRTMPLGLPGELPVKRERQDPTLMNVRDCPVCGKRASSSRSQTGITYYYCRNPNCRKGQSSQKFVGWSKG